MVNVSYSAEGLVCVFRYQQIFSQMCSLKIISDSKLVFLVAFPAVPSQIFKYESNITDLTSK